MAVQNYSELIIWQKSVDLVEQIYSLSKRFPKEEIYGLTSQIRRAAVSVPSNIAEGQSRHGTAEFRNFLSIARGSISEVETQLIIASRLGYISEEDKEALLTRSTEIKKMMNSLLSKLAKR